MTKIKKGIYSFYVPFFTTIMFSRSVSAYTDEETIIKSFFATKRN